MTKADNNSLGGVAPSVYRRKMPTDAGDVEASNVLPDNTFSDNYDLFIRARSELLLRRALALLNA